jgi:sulfite reductase alpha subunit-like flavoprotein
MSTHQTLALCLVATTTVGLYYYYTSKRKPTTSTSPTGSDSNTTLLPSSSTPLTPLTATIPATPTTNARTNTIRIAYGTQTGTAKRLASLLQADCSKSLQSHPDTNNFTTSLVNMKTYDVDNLEKEHIIIFIMCTWEGGVPPDSATIFCNWLEDMALDFRVPNTFLSNTSYAVFGLGSSEYSSLGDDRYCKAALLLDEHVREPSMLWLVWLVWLHLHTVH